MPSPEGPVASNPSPEPPDESATQAADAKPAKPGWRRPGVVVPVIAVLAALAVLALFLRPATTSAETAAPSPTATLTPKASASVQPSAAPAATVTGPIYQQPGPPAGSPLERVDPLRVDVSSDLVGTTFGESTAGLSFEATDLADPALSANNASTVALLKGMDKPFLRFGGRAVDRRFFWTSSGEALPASYVGDKAHVPRAVGPADLARVESLLEATDAKLTITVDLGHYDPTRAADFVKYAAKTFGDRLLSVTVGNEPNGFAADGVRPKSYQVGDYLKELQAYANAIYQVAPNLPISGPGTYEESWWQPFADVKLPQRKILTFHYYGLFSCDGKNGDSSPVMSNLMSPRMHERAIQYVGEALKVGRAAGIETWMPETGASTCPGSNEITKTHASALWAADYSLNTAQQGISRLAFHSSLLTCTGGPPMSAICSGGPYLKPNGVVSPRANYFGITMASSLEGGKFLKTTSNGGGLAFNYALQNADGSTTVILINENNPEKAAQTDVSLTLPGKPRTGTMTQLTGPSYAAQDGTLIDGAQSGPTPPAKRATVEGFRPGSSDQSFKLTAGTVTVLTFTY